jgi:hypothetical protein
MARKERIELVSVRLPASTRRKVTRYREVISAALGIPFSESAACAALILHGLEHSETLERVAKEK